MTIKRSLSPIKISTLIVLFLMITVLSLGLIYLFKKNEALLFSLKKIDLENKINCPRIDQYFNLKNEIKTFEKNKLLPIDTKLTFHSPGSLAINTYQIETAFTHKIENTISIFGLKEGSFNSNTYLPMIYDVAGDQNSSIVPGSFIIENNLNFQFFDSPNIVVGINRHWIIFTQALCNLGEICTQKLYDVDSKGSIVKIINIPKEYSLETIAGIYNNNIILELYDNSLVEYNLKTNKWNDFPNNVQFTKLNRVENIMKKYGCFYISAYQGDVVFYKHKLFSTGYPDFKWVDVFYNKK